MVKIHKVGSIRQGQLGQNNLKIYLNHYCYVNFDTVKS